MLWDILILVFWIGVVQGFLLNVGSWRCSWLNRSSATVISYGDHCYEFNLDTETYWHQAGDDCRSRGGHLVVIKDRQTQTFLENVLRFYGTKRQSVWIGLSNTGDYGTWHWVTGDRLDGFTHWKAGEDGGGFIHSFQDCVIMDEDSGLWYDTMCNTWPEYYRYICQYDALPTTTRRTTTTTTTTPTSATTSATTTTTTTTTTSTPATYLPTSISTESATSFELTVSTTASPTTVSTRNPVTVVCSAVNCAQSCPHGYTGIYNIQCWCS